MARRIRNILAVVGVLIVATVAIGTWQYFSWSGQGDAVAFSPTGDLGWGSRPYLMHDANKAPHRVGTVQSYLFIAHAHTDNDVAGDLTVAKH